MWPRTQIFLTSFAFLFFWNPYNSDGGALNVVPEISGTILISFHSLFFILFCLSYFYHSVFHLTYPFFASLILLIGSLYCIFISVMLFIVACLFFIYFRSFLNVSCIFSSYASILFIPTSILFPRFWIIFTIIAAAASKSFQPRPTLCNPIDDSPPDSPVPGILQARTLEWVAISFSNA